MNRGGKGPKPRRTKSRMSPLLLLAVTLAGCTALSSSILYEHHLPSRNTPADSVPILDRYPERTYVELGKVEARAAVLWVSWESLHAKLQAEAARLGADAIVKVIPSGEPDDHLDWTGLSWLDAFFKTPRHVSGLAIRYL